MRHPKKPGASLSSRLSTAHGKISLSLRKNFLFFVHFSKKNIIFASVIS